MTPAENLEHTLSVTNIVVAWVSMINLPLLLLIVRMLWGFNNRLTTLEVKARNDGNSEPYRRYYRRPQKETEE